MEMSGIIKAVGVSFAGLGIPNRIWKADCAYNKQDEVRILTTKVGIFKICLKTIEMKISKEDFNILI